MLNKQLFKAIPIAIFIIVAFFSLSDAAIKLEVDSGEDGFYLKYNIPVVGRGNIRLKNPGDTDTVTVRIMAVKLADVEITLNEITSDPDLVNLHYVVSGKFIPEAETIEGDIPVPFGSLGATVNFNGKKLIPTGDSALDVSLLLTQNMTVYDLNVNLELDIFGQALNIDETFSGTAGPSDNLIHEVVTNPYDDSVLLDINIEVEYLSSLVTVFHYDIVSQIPSFEPAEEDSEGISDLPLQGSITIPNGSYHVWLDFDPANYLPGFP